MNIKRQLQPFHLVSLGLGGHEKEVEIWSPKRYFHAKPVETIINFQL